VHDFTKSLIEEVEPATSHEDVELDRLLLRIFEHPALVSYLNKVGKGAGNVAELDFDLLPDSAIETLKSVVGPTKVEVFKFDAGGKPHLGIKIDLNPRASGAKSASQ
jgi:hypothetical protein